MKLFGTTFLRLGKYVLILNGQDPLKRFDLSRLKLEKYTPPKTSFTFYYKIKAASPAKETTQEKE